MDRKRYRHIWTGTWETRNRLPSSRASWTEHTFNRFWAEAEEWLNEVKRLLAG